MRILSERFSLRFAVCVTVLAFAVLPVPDDLSAQTPSQRPPGGFPDLVSALKAVPGCIGVETARTTSGKNVIFAWFEDKKAVLRWYYSETHQQVMRGFAGGASSREPLQDVPDDIGPIMAIASITFSDKPHFEGVSMPISQIAIELYSPVTGGLFLGGRFAPDGLKVSKIRDYTPKTGNDK